ncbi:Uncharacterised protein [Mycobacteroides abscessus subsp. abscessus]|nr:Uncharacterised protein [Mycobacteroides abscessus subsp. abscessus]
MAKSLVLKWSPHNWVSQTVVVVVVQNLYRVQKKFLLLMQYCLLLVSVPALQIGLPLPMLG